MGNVAGVMKKVNESVNTEETAKIMQQFAVENEKMNMSEEMMDDALIDAVRAERISFIFVTQEASTKLITPASTISRDGCQWKEEHRMASLSADQTHSHLLLFLIEKEFTYRGVFSQHVFLVQCSGVKEHEQ